jgi:hypothetical protein
VGSTRPRAHLLGNESRASAESLRGILVQKDAARRRFEIVMAWSVDRLGRSLPDWVLAGTASTVNQSAGIRATVNRQCSACWGVSSSGGGGRSPGTSDTIVDRASADFRPRCKIQFPSQTRACLQSSRGQRHTLSSATPNWPSRRHQPEHFQPHRRALYSFFA